MRMLVGMLKRMLRAIALSRPALRLGDLLDKVGSALSRYQLYELDLFGERINSAEATSMPANGRTR